MQHPGGPGEAEEISAQPFRRIAWHVRVEEEAAELLSGAENLLAAMAVPAGVLGSQVEELERSLEGTLEPRRSPGVPGPDGALYFASHVAELLDKLQAAPGARGGSLVEGAWHVGWSTGQR